MKHILFCEKCKKYSMKENCPLCGEKTIVPKPGKFSPVDTYGRERRIARKLEEQKK